MSQHVVVVGAGLVGAAAALALAKHHQVTLIEPLEPAVQKGALGVDLRNVAISPASRNLLNRLGAWNLDQLATYHKMVVWEQWGTGSVAFEAQEVGLEQMGWIVEVSGLARSLWEVCEAHPSVAVQVAKVEKIELMDDTGVTLTLGSGEQVVADFVVACDGAQSRLRQHLDVAVTERPVDQVALATVVETEHPHEQTARQRFLLDGPLALLPSRYPNLCSVVWSQSPAEGKRRLGLDEEQFCAEIGSAIEHRLGRVVRCDRRVVFPLTQHYMSRSLHAERVLFIGDAAHVLHPLAGLGVNLGFEDVAGVEQVAAQHASLNNASAWNAFVRTRQARANAMVRTLEMFKVLYAQAGPLTTLARNLAVDLFDRSGIAKRQVMREAMGLGPISRV